MARYLTAIVESDDRGWAFRVPQLPGYAAQFDLEEVHDLEAAVARAENVLADYLGAMQESGPLPDELVGNASLPSLESGEAIILLAARPRSSKPVRINLSIDTETLARIDSAAEARGMTRSGYMAQAALEFG